MEFKKYNIVFYPDLPTYPTPYTELLISIILILSWDYTDTLVETAFTVSYNFV